MNMTIIIVILLLLAYLLIGTANFTNVNKAAVVMFLAVVCWVLYISFGYGFVVNHHPREYLMYLMGDVSTSDNVKYFIAQNIFLKYIGRAAEVVLFLLATMSIMDILETNGCFDFLSDILRTRSSKKMLWLLVLITFVLSANIDNVTVTTMMLVLMHKLISKRSQRMIFGCAVMLAANCGGCLTVIGDPIGLALWSGGAVTASSYSATLFVPTLISCVIPVWLLSRKLPDRVDLQWVVAPYRGDSTRMGQKQRIVMGLVALVGLWFIPTFHSITKLSPFLGALCVLSILWVVNEIYNRKLMSSDQMVKQTRPMASQYGSIQMILYVIGIMLALGVVKETGFLSQFADWVWDRMPNVFIFGTLAGLISTVLESFTTAMTFMSMFDIAPEGMMGEASYFVQNGAYWKIIAFCTAIGGSMISVGSLSGIVLMKMENIKISWFLKHFSSKVFLGWLLGMFFLFAEIYLI